MHSLLTDPDAGYDSADEGPVYSPVVTKLSKHFSDYGSASKIIWFQFSCIYSDLYFWMKINKLKEMSKLFILFLLEVIAHLELFFCCKYKFSICSINIFLLITVSSRN